MDGLFSSSGPMEEDKQQHGFYVPAIVLAAGKNRRNLAANYRPELKALVSFSGTPSFLHVTRALQKVQKIGDIAIVGPDSDLRKELEENAHLKILHPGKTLLENIATGVRHFRRHPAVLIAPADLPLLSPEAIEEFLEKCHEHDESLSGVYWAMVPQRCFRGPYAKIQKGFNRFRDETVCHGNLLLITPDILEKFAINTPLEALYRARKSSLRVAFVCGWRVALSYLMGVVLLRRFTLGQMAERISQRFNVEIHPVLVCRPEVALDVDEQDDYRLVNRIFKMK